MVTSVSPDEPGWLRLQPPGLRPVCVAIGVPSGSHLEASLLETGFSTRDRVAELEQDHGAAPSLLLLRTTIDVAVAELQRLRDVPALARVPIICVLGDGRREDLRVCERASAFACLREPVSSQALAAAIEAGLAGAGRRMTLAPPSDSSSLVSEIELRIGSPNQVPAAVSALAALCPEPARQSLGISELIMNAIEHGNLEISGDHKAELLTRGNLGEEIARRLIEPRFAGREARVRLTRYPDHVELVIEDAGPGFDWRKQLEKVIDFEAPCGRGLRLAQQLAFDSLEYLGQGNVAIARVRREVNGQGGLVGISDWERRSLELYTERFLERQASSEFFAMTLSLCRELSGSTRGLVGYLDNFGMVVVPVCQGDRAPASYKPTSVAREDLPDALRRTLLDGSAHVSEQGLRLDLVGGEAHPEPALCVPIVQAGRVAGFVQLAGAPGGYTGLDAERVEIGLAKLSTLFVAQVQAALAWSARQRLEEATVAAQYEQEAAAHMMQCLRREPSLDPDVRQFSAGKELFNGDLILSERLADGRLRAMLADFVGHGLSAAVGGLPLSSIFRATARKLIPLAEVLTTMNDSLRGFLPRGYFCGAVLLDLDVERRCVQFWNGGMPASLLWRSSDAQLSGLPSEHLPLGVVSSSDLGVEPRTLPITPGDQLVIMSDGVTEFENPSGELFGFSGIERALRAGGEPDAFDAIINALSDFGELVTQANDDMSLIRLCVRS
jgi:serine phosphatase RsbU (regulator of sigma subunit)